MSTPSDLIWFYFKNYLISRLISLEIAVLSCFALDYLETLTHFLETEDFCLFVCNKWDYICQFLT